MLPSGKCYEDLSSNGCQRWRERLSQSIQAPSSRLTLQSSRYLSLLIISIALKESWDEGGTVMVYCPLDLSTPAMTSSIRLPQMVLGSSANLTTFSSTTDSKP